MPTIEKIYESVLAAGKRKSKAVSSAASSESVKGCKHCFVGGDKMYRYERIVYWSDADNRFLVEVPELPGCMADGATVGEAIANCEVIIREWLEVAKEDGRKIPQPKGRLAIA